MSNQKLPATLRRRILLGIAVLVACPLLNAQSNSSPVPEASLFFHKQQMTGAALSPDGTRLAMRTIASNERAMLSVLDLNTMTPSIAYQSDGADVDRMVWVNHQRLAFTLNDRDTPQGKLDAGPGLFAVNSNGSEFRQLVERQQVFFRNGNDTKKLEPWNTFLLDGTTSRDDDDVMVVRPESFSDKDMGYVRLLRLNTKTVQVDDIEGPMHSVAWLADSDGKLRVVTTRDGERGTLRWKNPVSGEWRVLSEFNVYTEGDDMQVRHVGADGRLYISARRGRDKQAMWLLDPVTSQWSSEPLAQSPQFDVDAHVVARKDKVLGLRFTIDAEVTQWLDPAMQSLQKQLDKVLPRTTNRLTVPWQGDSPWVLIEAVADVQPTLYFLFNRESKKFTRLGAERPDIDAKQMAARNMVRIKARDGLEIPAWLTLPLGQTSQKNLPMVVLVHGGPFVHASSWQWNAEVQFLAARGYAVLQPQFRGTKGFGEAHYKAGWRQWGKTMQTDLADAARWAIDQGIADPKRVAIAGGSYGGYAALMGLVRDAGLFRCGVAWIAVTDLDMLHTVDWDDISSDYKRHGMPKLLGDRMADGADLKANSPLTHAVEIKQPLLLAYGSDDKRVPIVHGEKFRKAVQAVNRSVEWVEYADEGHGWRVPANQVDFWNRTVQFLDKNLAN